MHWSVLPARKTNLVWGEAMNKPVHSHTFLLESARTGNLVGIERAIERGADVNEVEDGFGAQGALHVAAIHDQYAVIERLIDRHHADVNILDNKSKATPLMLATRNGHPEIMELLIQRKADVHLADALMQDIYAFATQARRNAGEVWDKLLSPAFGLDKDETYRIIKDARTIEGVINSFLIEGEEAGDPAGLAALIRRGADWRTHIFFGNSMLYHVADGAIPYSDEPRDKFVPRTAEALKHLFAVGVPPLYQGAEEFSAYELALETPGIRQVFRDASTHFADQVAQFKPARDKLLVGGKPTDMVMYCCYEERLGELLASALWENSSELVSAKRALNEALPERWRRKYAAELDPTSVIRTTATQGKNWLGRLARPNSEQDVG